MKTILAVIAILMIGSAYSQATKEDVPPVTVKTEASNKGGNHTKGKLDISVNLPSTVNVTVDGKIEVNSEKRETRTYEEPSKWVDPITWFTFALAVANIFLWLTTRNLVREAKTASGIAKQSADATKEAANAAIVASMPVLSPLIVGLNRLHPLTPVTDTFNAYVPFVFENFGKTPGIIREVRADLFLNEMDAFPVVEFEKLPLIGYEPIVAGDSRGQNALMGVAECSKEFTLSQIEVAELLAEATGRYRRFALIGRVIYDDFFGMRHIRCFCVKMRRMGETDMFQLVRGGPAYNRVDRHKIPEK